MSKRKRENWRSDLPEPGPIDVRQARGELTQADAAALIGYAGPAKWSRIESGDARPSAQAWELFLLRTGQHPTLQLVERHGR